MDRNELIGQIKGELLSNGCILEWEHVNVRIIKIVLPRCSCWQSQVQHNRVVADKPRVDQRSSTVSSCETVQGDVRCIEVTTDNTGSVK